MRCVLLCTLEAVEFSKFAEAMRCMLLVLCLPDAVEVVEVAEVMRCVLLCTLEAVEFSKFAGSECALCYSVRWRSRGDEICLLVVLEVMRCVLLCTMEAVSLSLRR